MRSRSPARSRKPRNDHFSQASPIARLPFAAVVPVGGASVEPGEPSPCTPSRHTLWYVLDPPRDGQLEVDLTGSTPPDPVVRLYRVRRPDLRGLELLACASPAWNGLAAVSAPVNAGERYAIQVGTAVSDGGRLRIAVSLAPEPGDGGGPARVEERC
jgi:hypothetical protein